MLTITLADHVFHGQTTGLRHHVSGAVQYVAQYLRQRPWAESYEAWIVTQSFVLHTLMSQIMGATTDLIPDTAKTLHEVFHDVIANPEFAYTLGSTPRMMKALYQARMLETQLAAEDPRPQGETYLSGDHLHQAKEIITELHAPLDAEVDIYMVRQRPTTTMAEQRRIVVSNLTLFNSAVSIYFYQMVLRYPSTAIADLVEQALLTAVALLEMDRAAVSIWPIVTAAVEAYTPEAQALADRALSLCADFGCANRQIFRQTVIAIWRRREEMAVQQGCEIGDIHMDWRQVLKQADVDILPL